MKPVAPPFFYRWLSPRWLICDQPGRRQEVFLTFDDGPVPETTPHILEILDRYKVKATFFMVGGNVKKHPGLYDEVIASGHRAGNHTFHHLNGWKTAPGAYLEDADRCRELVPGDLFRPPYGRFTPSQYLIMRNRYRFILWSVLTWDFHQDVTPEQCLTNALTHTRGGSVVVFHDNAKALEKVQYALPRFLERILSEGLTPALL